jgi:hypothetical protein
MVTRTEFNIANQHAREMQEANPRAISAKYDRRTGLIEVRLDSGMGLTIPPRCVEGLENAKPSQLGEIEISPSGFGIHFPKLDEDLYLPALLEGFLGSRKWMAARLGTAGGHSRSAAKASAARLNGQLGGRPKSKKAAARAS